MTKPPTWRRYLRFWRSDVARDIDDELRFHIEMRLQEYRARGLTEDEARRLAGSRLGDLAAARADCIAIGQKREAHLRGANFLADIQFDVRYALRSLRRTPGWTAVALLTIALGVGATTAVWSVADALIVRPFRYPGASRVYLATREFKYDTRSSPSVIPYSLVSEWRRHARSIESVASYAPAGSPRIGALGDAAPLQRLLVDTAFLPFAGARLVLGRNFAAEETVDGGPPAVILAEHYWRRRFGGAPGVLGKTLDIDGRKLTIVGVAPASLSVPHFRSERADVLLPLLGAKELVYSLVRLKPGVGLASASDELNAILTNGNFVDDIRSLRGIPVHLSRPSYWLPIRQSLLLLVCAVALVLLVAWTNVAHLLLARGFTRQREVSVRHALGASRARLFRQLLTESVVLAALGGMLAGFVAWAVLQALLAARPASIPSLTYVTIDHSVVWMAVGIATACGVIVGVLVGTRNAYGTLAIGQNAGAPISARRTMRVRLSLVVGQVALSSMLLASALLLVHAVFNRQRADVGFNPRGLYVLSAPPTGPMPGAAPPPEEFAERVKRLPGIEGITMGSVPGVAGFGLIVPYETPDRLGESMSDRRSTAVRVVPANYFDVIDMPIEEGRTFDDGSLGANEAIVSRAFAQSLWPNQWAVGQRFRRFVSSGEPVSWSTVIGVVPDAISNLTDELPEFAIYRPMPSTERGPLIVRLPDKTTSLLAQLTTSADPSDKVTITDVREGIGRTLAVPRFVTVILGTLAAINVLLAAIGLFGVVSYGVSQRTREIGVRVALGASQRSIAWLILGSGIGFAAIGIVVGLAGAVTVTPFVQGVLVGIPNIDPLAMSVSAGAILGSVGMACFFPLLRATRIDPALAMRVD